tara:strand:- start:4 stop:210 length:207 start_codon:yes stop_codon:yes gene_type:complete
MEAYCYCLLDVDAQLSLCCLSHCHYVRLAIATIQANEQRQPNWQLLERRTLQNTMLDDWNSSYNVSIS